jgi:hypothetical protein
LAAVEIPWIRQKIAASAAMVVGSSGCKGVPFALKFESGIYLPGSAYPRIPSAGSSGWQRPKSGNSAGRLDEIAFPFRERNLVVPISKSAPTPSTQANEALSLR